MNLRSIAEEAAACRAAWAAAPEATMAWHCHHKRLAEPLTKPPENRISFILTYKPEAEQSLRLRLFRPASPAVEAAQAAYHAAVKPALAAFTAAVKSARDDAVNPAAWDASVNSALAAYTAVLKPAWAALTAALAPLHAAECPDCPWGGRTIFP